MQFYENYVRLCNQAGEKPTSVAEKVGIARATASRWSRGMIPSYPSLVKIADYFGISVGELIGATPENISDMAKYFNVSESLFQITKAAEEGKAESSENMVEEMLEVLRTSPGRRALLAATKNMTEEQVEIMANFAKIIRGDD